MLTQAPSKEYMENFFKLLTDKKLDIANKERIIDTFIKQTSIDTITENNYTFLIFALLFLDDFNLVKLFLEKGANVRAFDNHKINPFIIVFLLRPRADFIELFLPLSIDTTGLNSLESAANSIRIELQSYVATNSTNHLADIASALSLKHLESLSNEDKTFLLKLTSVKYLLFECLHNNQPAYLQFFLDNGVDSNWQDDEGETLLHQACLQQKNDYIDLLLSYEKTNLNQKNKQGHSPLGVAVDSGNVEAVEKLLKANADISIVINCIYSISASKEKYRHPTTLLSTALYKARICKNNPERLKNYSEIAILLLKHHNNLTNFLHRDAKLCPYPGLLPDHADLIIKLFDIGLKKADETIQIGFLDENGDYEIRNATPLHLAAMYNSESLLNYLIEHKFEGVDINVKDDLGLTPFARSFNSNNISLWQKLLKLGADPNSQDAEGETLLHIACLSHNSKLLDYLLSYPGINLNIKNKQQHSALGIAVDKMNVEAVDKLLKANADISIEINSKYKGENKEKYSHFSSLLLHALYGASINKRQGYIDIAVLLLKKHNNLSNFVNPLAKKCPYRGLETQVVIKLFEVGLQKADDVIQAGFSTSTGEISIHKSTPLHLAAMYHNQALLLFLNARKFKNVNINVKDEFGFTPFYRACFGNNVWFCEKLVSLGADITLGFPIITASAQGNVAVVEFLIKHGVNINEANAKGKTALYTAIFNQRNGLISFLLNKHAALGASLKFLMNDLINFLEDKPHSLSETFFKLSTEQLAALSSQDKQFLLDFNKINNNSLVFKLLENQQLTWLKFFFDNGVDINITDENGLPLLFLACLDQHTDTIELLLSYPTIDVNFKDFHGYSALSIAVRFAHKAAVEKLLAAGADGSITMDVGLEMIGENFDYPVSLLLFALYMAGISTDQQYDDIAVLLLKHDNNFSSYISPLAKFCPYSWLLTEKTDLVIKLFELGIKKADDPIQGIFEINDNEVLFCQTTPLHLAIYYKNERLLDYLIAHKFDKADVNVRAELGQTPLFLACSISEPDLNLIEKLLELGADPDIDSNQDSALNRAVAGGLIEIVELLYNAGADINKSNAEGITPLASAIRNKREEVLKFLLEKNVTLEIQDPLDPNQKESALQFAYRLKASGIVKILIKHHADNFFIAEPTFTIAKNILLHGQDFKSQIIKMNAVGKKAINKNESNVNNTLEIKKYLSKLKRNNKTQFKQKKNTANKKNVAEKISSQTEQNNNSNLNASTFDFNNNSAYVPDESTNPYRILQEKGLTKEEIKELQTPYKEEPQVLTLKTPAKIIEWYGGMFSTKMKEISLVESTHKSQRFFSYLSPEIKKQGCTDAEWEKFFAVKNQFSRLKGSEGIKHSRKDLRVCPIIDYPIPSNQKIMPLTAKLKIKDSEARVWGFPVTNEEYTLVFFTCYAPNGHKNKALKQKFNYKHKVFIKAPVEEKSKADPLPSPPHQVKNT